MPRSFAFIVNPFAGRGKARGMDSKIFHMVKREPVKYSIETTSDRYHGIVLASQASKDHDVVVAVGGDGTVHEVANGVIGSDAELSVLPVGSGNDFAHSIGLTHELERSMVSVLQGKRMSIDVGLLEFETDEPGRSRAKYFVNSLGVGIDAAIAYEAQKIRWLKGLPLYLYSTLKTLGWFRPMAYRVESDAGEFSRRMYVVCVGNGRREGGGFYVTPDADPTDGKFQACFVEALPLTRALQLLPKILKGTHGGEAGIEFRDVRSVRISSAEPFVAHADGEILGQKLRSLTVQLQPKALSVLTGL